MIRVPEAHEGNLGIDRALRFRAQGRVGRRGVAHGAHLAIGAEDAAVRRDLIHRCDPEAEVRHRFRVRQRFVHCGSEATQGFTLEGALEIQRIDAGVLQDLLRAKIAVRGVVLMQRVDGDAGGHGVGRGGQRGPKQIVALVGNADPVHRAQHDGLAGAEQHDAPGAQAEVPGVGDRVVRHAAADGRGDVDVKGGHAQCIRLGDTDDEEERGEGESDVAAKHGARLVRWPGSDERADRFSVFGFQPSKTQRSEANIRHSKFATRNRTRPDYCRSRTCRGVMAR